VAAVADEGEAEEAALEVPRLADGVQRHLLEVHALAPRREGVVPSAAPRQQLLEAPQQLRLQAPAQLAPRGREAREAREELHRLFRQVQGAGAGAGAAPARLLVLVLVLALALVQVLVLRRRLRTTATSHVGVPGIGRRIDVVVSRRRAEHFTPSSPHLVSKNKILASD
jgi:hypothetical protein